MRSRSSIHEAKNFPEMRLLASANPAGTPMIMASSVELPAVMKLFSRASGKFDPAMER